MSLAVFFVFKNMEDLATEVVETPEVVDSAIPEPTETLEPAVEIVTEDVPEAEVVEEKGEGEPTEEAAAETPAESITFDTESPEFITKANEVLEKYDLSELPPDLAALIPALIAKTNAPVEDVMAAYADFGDTEAVKVLLDREALLTGVERISDTEFRPTTDKFVATLDAQTGSWLYHDLAKQPSTEYPGITQFEEGIVNVFGKEGDTVGSVLARYQEFVTAMKAGSFVSDVPEFIPTNLREAYYDLSKAERDEISLLSPEYDDDAVTIQQKLHTLERVQKGLDSDKQNAQREIQSKQERQQAFTSTVIEKQTSFYDAFRDQVAKDLAKEVVFSTDPKMQSILTAQHVSLLGDLFEDGSKGNFARKTLADAGIEFSQTEAQGLLDAVQKAAVALTAAEQTVDANGKQLDEINLNKARTQFRNAGKAWQDRAKDVIGKLSRLTSTGKAEEVKAAAEKIKVAAKARPATKGAPSSQKQDTSRPPVSVQYGTPAWDAWWAKQTLAEQAEKAARYQRA